jgi:hypothetical protein
MPNLLPPRPYPQGIRDAIEWFRQVGYLPTD